MTSSEYLICNNPIYTKWRSDELDVLFAAFCIALILININAVIQLLRHKEFRKQNSVRLFVVAFLGNIYSLTATSLVCILRVGSNLTCKTIEGLYVLYQYGMSTSSYALLILIYVNVYLSRQPSVLSVGQLKTLTRKTIIYCYMILFGNLGIAVIPILAKNIKLAFIPVLLHQVAADIASVIFCYKLFKVYKRVATQVVHPIDPTFLKQVKESRKLVLPAVVINNVFKFVHYTFHLILFRCDGLSLKVLVHLQTIYCFEFLIVPTFLLYSKKRAGRNKLKVQPLKDSLFQRKTLFVNNESLHIEKPAVIENGHDRYEGKRKDDDKSEP